MRAAVPMFNEDIAPRFGFADRFLVGDIDNHQLVSCEEVCLESRGWPHRLEEIRNLGIETLLCCGFNRQFIPLSETLGIRVITGLSGTGREVLERFAQGAVMTPNRGCARSGRGGGRGRGNGSGRGKGRCQQ